MSGRRMRMRVYRKDRKAPHFTIERRWAWRCQWCQAGGSYVNDVVLPIIYDEAWRHGWECWGYVNVLRPKVYVSPLDEKRALRSNLSPSESTPSPSHQGDPESAPVFAPAGENTPRRMFSAPTERKFR
jgi:hypothetical protein